MINLKQQTLASLALPTGIYAFYRIKKLRLGILIEILSGLLYSSSLPNILYLLHYKLFGLYFITSCFIFGFSFVIPIIFIRKWTIQYNRKTLESQKSTNS